MKCNIIKDLLPLYNDKLTSIESNEEIEIHLNECEKCKKYYENISSPEDTINISDKEIEPLKKLKKHNIAKNVITGALSVVVAFLVFITVFYGVIPMKSEDISYTVKVEERVTDENIIKKGLEFEFAGDCKCTREVTDVEYIGENGLTNHEITFFSCIPFPFDNRGKYPNTFELGVENIKEGDTLTIHYREKDEVIDLYSLYLELNNKKESK